MAAALAPRLTHRDFRIPTGWVSSWPPGVSDMGLAWPASFKVIATKNRSLTGAAQRGQRSPLARGILRQRQPQNRQIWDAPNLRSLRSQNLRSRMPGP